MPKILGGWIKSSFCQKCLSKLQGGHIKAGMVPEIVLDFICPNVGAKSVGSNTIVAGRYLAVQCT